MRKFIIAISALALIIAALYASSVVGKKSDNSSGSQSAPTTEDSSQVDDLSQEVSDPLFDSAPENIYSREFPKLDITKSSVDLDLILSGGPPRDGIPPIDDPKFESVKESKVDDEVAGLLVNIDGDKRFYPYNIMVWHEIVNDTVGGKDLSVTFCPLCGSAIVFDREVDGEIYDFGTSGKLFESNLVMYDRQTESFWSQARGEAIVGSLLGKKLDILPFSLLTMEDIRKNHKGAMVLSADTGHNRNYSFYPYSGYSDDESLFFPVSVDDNRFEAKEIFFIVPTDDGYSYAVKQKDIPFGEGREFTLKNGKEIFVENGDEGIIASIDGEQAPGYFEMWFSWATHHQEDGVVLTSE